MHVGILGLVGSGKSTFAKMLQEELATLGHSFSLESYAKPLKVLTSVIFDLTLEELEDRVIKEKPVQVPRDVMLDRVFECLVDVLQFNNDELDKASELYFEHFSSARAISPREFQQVFGTDVVRAVRPTAWVEYLQSYDSNLNLIVTDVRFDNELCDVNFLIIREQYTPEPTHSSEYFAWSLENLTEYPYETVDYYIDNARSTSLYNLRHQTKRYAARISKQL